MILFFTLLIDRSVNSLKKTRICFCFILFQWHKCIPTVFCWLFFAGHSGGRRAKGVARPQGSRRRDERIALRDTTAILANLKYHLCGKEFNNHFPFAYRFP